MNLEEVLARVARDHVPQMSTLALSLWERRAGAVALIVPSTGYVDGDFAVTLWFPAERLALFIESVFVVQEPDVAEFTLDNARDLLRDLAEL